MRFELLIASRYLKSKKANSFISRISIIAMGIITFAVLIPMVTMSVMNGFHDSITEKHINKDFHVQIKRGNFVNYKKIMQKILSYPQLKKEIKHITPFFRGPAQVNYADGRFYGILCRGIQSDFFKEDKTFLKHFPIIAGSYNLEKKFSVVMGDKLVQFMNPERKDYLQFLDNVNNGKQEFINIIAFNDRNRRSFNEDEEKVLIFKLRVSGVFKSGYLEYDKNFLFTSLNTAQVIFNAKSAGFGSKEKIVTGIGIKLHNKDNALKVLNFLKTRFIDLSIGTWQSYNPHLLHAFKWEKMLMSVILVIMILASVIITIYINLNIIVMDKKREIGILKSFGVSNGSIRAIFISEAILISLIGTILGSVLSMLFLISLTDVITFIENIVNYIGLYFYEVIYSTKEGYINWEFLAGGLGHLKSMIYKIDFWDLLLLTSLSIFVSILAAYFPARKSTKESITQVIRYE